MTRLIPSGAADTAACIARLEAAALDLAGLRLNSGLAPYRAAAVGAELPFLPSHATLAAAAAPLEQVAHCLRHHADAPAAPAPGEAT